MASHRRKRRRRRYTLIKAVLFALAVSMALLMLFEFRIRPVFSEIALARAQSLAVTTINDEVNRIFISEGMEYGELMTIEKDAEGKITAIISVSRNVNRLKARVAQNVQNALRETDKMVTYIPLGAFLSKGLFSGYGPRVPVRLAPIGRATVEISDSFLDAGINQTRHEIHLVVRAKINVLMAGGSTLAEVETELPLVQSVIIGNVPDSYTHVSGVSGEPQDNVLNLLD